jgi:DNA repair photolyase
MSIPTDSEAVRQVFEPKAPPLAKRWEAVEKVRAHGIPVGICVTPMLPLEGPERFIRRLTAFRPDVLVVQDFHDSRGGFGADTGKKAREVLAQIGWSEAVYRSFKDTLRKQRVVYEGEAGFFPPA